MTSERKQLIAEIVAWIIKLNPKVRRDEKTGDQRTKEAQRKLYGLLIELRMARSADHDFFINKLHAILAGIPNNWQYQIRCSIDFLRPRVAKWCATPQTHYERTHRNLVALLMFISQNPDCTDDDIELAYGIVEQRLLMDRHQLDGAAPWVYGLYDATWPQPVLLCLPETAPC